MAGRPNIITPGSGSGAGPSEEAGWELLAEFDWKALGALGAIDLKAVSSFSAAATAGKAEGTSATWTISTVSGTSAVINSSGIVLTGAAFSSPGLRMTISDYATTSYTDILCAQTFCNRTSLTAGGAAGASMVLSNVGNTRHVRMGWYGTTQMHYGRLSDAGNFYTNGAAGTFANLQTMLLNRTSGEISYWGSKEASALFAPYGTTGSAAVPLPGTISMTDIEGLYHLENNVTDSSGNGRTGAASSATAVTGQVGTYAYQFAGSASSYVTLGGVTDFHYSTESFSVSGWFKPASTQVSNANLFGCLGGGAWGSGARGWWVDQNGVTHNNYRWGIRAGGTDPRGSNFALVANEWNHVVATRNGTTFKVYVNGILQTTDTLSATIEQTGNDSALILGRHGLGFTGSTHEWEGAADEVAIWSRELSAAEALAIFEEQRGPYGSDLVSTSTVGDPGSLFVPATDVLWWDVSTSTITLEKFALWRLEQV